MKDANGVWFPFVKRMTDILFSVAGILVFSPLFFLITVIIKIDSPGPVIFKQKRIGKNCRKNERMPHGSIKNNPHANSDRRKEKNLGRLFYIYKFRTMKKDAERHSGPVLATKDDPRTTRVGKLLRKTRLDELPQLFNVLKGEMSLVGPRPERPYFAEEFSKRINRYEKRFAVKPGITGMAQIYNGYDTCLEDVKRKVAYDMVYISKRSFFLDLKLMLLTLFIIPKGEGGKLEEEKILKYELKN